MIPADDRLINFRNFLGYDTTTNKLVCSVVVENGNFYLTADDWEEERLVWWEIISI